MYANHQDLKIQTFLIEDTRFQRWKIDKTLFIKSHKGDILLVQVYVDDIIFGSTKKELCIAFEKLMHEKFQMGSMGELIFFLGLQVKQKKDGIFISQVKYVEEILKKFRFAEVKTTSTPMETQKPLLKDKDGEEVDVHMYRSMIGSLMYLTSSRPDIMFVVCACARYQVNPKVSHLLAVKRIFRLISWQCKKQTVVANSITEAEYVAASSCYGQVLGIQNQLLDYGYNFMHTKIFIDNNNLLTKAFDEIAKKSVKLMMKKLFRMELELMLGRIDAIDADEEITLNKNCCKDVNIEVNVVEEEVNVINSAKLITMLATSLVPTEPYKPKKKKDLTRLDEKAALKLQAEFDEEERLAREKAEKEKEANIALIETWDDIQAKIDVDHQLAERLQAQEQEELIQVEFDEEDRLAREKAEKEKEANIALIETWDDIRAKIDADHQLAERLQAQEQEELSIEEKATLFQKLLDKRRKHFTAKRAEEKRNKPPTKAQQRKIMEDLEDLYKLVKAKYESTRPVEDLDSLLWGDFKTMFEPRVEDEVWRNQQEYKVLDWKLYDSCGVHSFDDATCADLYVGREEVSPCTTYTFNDEEKKLIIDYESEMAYQLLKFIMKHLK
ncbi:uncharacterized mitochondrial protein-like protein [Tanacetum coccineum]